MKGSEMTSSLLTSYDYQQENSKDNGCTWFLSDRHSSTGRDRIMSWMTKIMSLALGLFKVNACGTGKWGCPGGASHIHLSSEEMMGLGTKTWVSLVCV
jgi:hypothetical protein